MYDHIHWPKWEWIGVNYMENKALLTFDCTLYTKNKKTYVHCI